MEIQVTDIDTAGRGIGMADDREVACPGALPGDVLELLEGGAPPRVLHRAWAARTTPCPHRACDACPLLLLPYPEQLAAKSRQVRRALLRHFAPAALPEIAPTRPSPRQLGYRASAKLALARGPKEPRIGVYQRGSHRLVDLPRCPVHHPLVAGGIRALRSLLGRAPGLAGSWLRYAAFQASLAEDTLLLTLVTRGGARSAQLPALAARLREALPTLSGVVENINLTAGNAIFGAEWRPVWGRPFLRERFGSLRLRASAGAFLQANREQAAWVYAEASRWLAPAADEDALDLYCGVGGLGLHLAPLVRRVTGVETNPRAVADAQAAAGEACLGNANFRVGDAGAELTALGTEGFRPHLVTLNPARKGADTKTLETLRELGPRAILYVSCNPETLARDAAQLCADGAYQLARLQPEDFFPQTGHIETLALLQRR